MSEDPAGVRVRIGPFADAGLHVVERVGAEQVDAVTREAAGDERGVRVVEPGQHRDALGVDHRGLRAAIAQDLAIGADVEDGVAANGDGFGGGPECVRGVDLRVVDDEIDGSAAVVPLGADDQAGNQGGGHDRDNDICG